MEWSAGGSPAYQNRGGRAARTPILLLNIRILESQHIKHAVDADARNRLLCVLLYFWLGVICDAESREVEHREVVCTVANCNNLLKIKVFALPSTMSPT